MTYEEKGRGGGMLKKKIGVEILRRRNCGSNVAVSSVTHTFVSILRGDVQFEGEYILTEGL